MSLEIVLQSQPRALTLHIQEANCFSYMVLKKRKEKSWRRETNNHNQFENTVLLLYYKYETCFHKVGKFNFWDFTKLKISKIIHIPVNNSIYQDF